MSAQAAARAHLRALFPQPGPWTSAALWHGRVALPVPSAPLHLEVDAIHDQRLAGSLLRFARDTGVPLDGEVRTSLQRSSLRWMAVTTAATQQARDAVDRLRSLGFEPVVSKGPGIARWYPGPESRPYSDIDLLIPPSRFGEAVRVLHRTGWREDERNHQPRAFMRRVCREGLNLRSAAGGSIDVHHRLPPWLWSQGVDRAGMTARAEDVTTAGATFRCLSAVDNAVVAALHVVSDNNAPGRSLRVWRDLVEAVHRCPRDQLAEVAGGAGLAGWLRDVLLALPAYCGVRDLALDLPEQRVPHPVRLNALLSERFDRFGVFATQCLRLPVPNAVAFGAGMALPSRSFVRTKFAGDPHPYRRWYHLAAERIDSAPDAATRR